MEGAVHQGPGPGSGTALSACFVKLKQPLRDVTVARANRRSFNPIRRTLSTGFAWQAD
jgi:hypothetical protein